MCRWQRRLRGTHIREGGAVEIQGQNQGLFTNKPWEKLWGGGKRGGRNVGGHRRLRGRPIKERGRRRITGANHDGEMLKEG